MSVIYSFIYLLYSTYTYILPKLICSLPFVFGKRYEWNEAQAGMSYLGMALGSIAGLSIVYFGSDRISESMTKKHGVKSAEVYISLSNLCYLVSTYIVLLGTVSLASGIVHIWMVSAMEGALVYLSL